MPSKLAKIASLLRDPTRFLDAVGQSEVDKAQRRFDGEHDPEGVPWWDLSPNYAPIKKGPSILTETRAMRDSITYQIDAGAGTVTVGPSSGNPGKERAHQGFFGNRTTITTVGRGVQLRARPYIGMGDQDVPNVGNALVNAIQQVAT